MSNLFRKAALAAIVAGGASPVLAADLAERPIVIEEPPVIQQPYEEVSDFGGWYIRGDLDYHKSKIRGAEYITYGIEPCHGCGDGFQGVGGTKSFDTTEQECVLDRRRRRLSAQPAFSYGPDPRLLVQDQVQGQHVR
jgi:opacity protein-like surface antigen